MSETPKEIFARIFEKAKMNESNKTKSILVIDTPTGCTNCPLFYYNEICCNEFGHNYECSGTNGSHRPIAIYGYQIKPDWCPLKELPQKQVVHSIDNEFQRGAKTGYNYCLNRILEGETHEG